jgi:hypothetical protein
VARLWTGDDEHGWKPVLIKTQWEFCSLVIEQVLSTKAERRELAPLAQGAALDLYAFSICLETSVNRQFLGEILCEKI